MQRLLVTLALVLRTTVAATEIRRLEDGQYEMMNGYFMFSKCLRVKIAQDNDDDGNAYFYNGAYRSQSQAYAAYVKCDQGCGGSCDTSVAYVAGLDDTMNVALQYTQGYCGECVSSCGNRRRLEEEDYGNRYYSVDCDTCVSECASLSGNGASNGEDESYFLDCQYSYTDNDGLDFYSGPSCSSDGSLVMGLFYDNECTIKKNDDDSGFTEKFAYNSFHAIESVCFDCQDGVCDDLFNGATSCVDGKTANGEADNSGVCKTYKRMSKEWQYAKAKKNYHLPFLLLCMTLVGLAFFLAYSYYVRHKNANSSSTKTALLETENDTSGISAPQSPYTQSP